MDKVLEKFRRLCLSYPETNETGSFGHPNFRAGKKTFAVIEWYGERPSFGFKTGAENVDLFLLQGDQFFATPYGRGQWVSIRADGDVDWRLVEELLDMSYRQVALKRMLAVMDRTKP